MRCLFWLSQKMFRHKKRRSSECYLAAIHYLSFGGFFASFERETDEHPCLLWAQSGKSTSWLQTKTTTGDGRKERRKVNGK